VIRRKVIDGLSKGIPKRPVSWTIAAGEFTTKLTKIRGSSGKKFIDMTIKGYGNQGEAKKSTGNKGNHRAAPSREELKHHRAEGKERTKQNGSVEKNWTLRK